MDIDATSHMTKSQGNLLNYSLLKHPLKNAIIIGNGHMIPVQGHGHIFLPSSHNTFTLKNVLHAIQFIKNLIFVQKFTRDNMVSVKFDPFGFAVKDLATGKIVLPKALVTSTLSNRHMEHSSHLPHL